MSICGLNTKSSFLPTHIRRNVLPCSTTSGALKHRTVATSPQTFAGLDRLPPAIVLTIGFSTFSTTTSTTATATANSSGIDIATAFLSEQGGQCGRVAPRINHVLELSEEVVQLVHHGRQPAVPVEHLALGSQHAPEILQRPEMWGQCRWEGLLECERLCSKDQVISCQIIYFYPSTIIHLLPSTHPPTHLERPRDVGYDGVWLQPPQRVHSPLALGIHLR